MKRVALYARVSTERQSREGDSVPAQLSALHQYATEHNYEIVGEFVDDGVSGTKYEERKKLQELLQLIEAGGADLLICTRLDRLFRSIKWYIAVQERLDRVGVGWLAIWEPMYDTTTPSGRLIVNQMMSIAQFEAENTGQRIRQVFEYKKSKGEVLSGNTPPGYRIENKHLAPSSDADHVLTVFRIYARTGSLRRTCIECRGLPGMPKSDKGIKRMLSNRAYIGEMNGVENAHPAIVPRGLFDNVQSQLGKNIKISQKREYIFCGLVRCAECGASLAAHTIRQRYKGKTYEYPAYRCPKHYMRNPKQCENKAILREKALEEHMLSQIRPYIEGLVLSYEIGEERRRSVEAQRAAAEKRLSRLKEAYLAEVIGLAEYKRDREEIERQLSSMKNAPTEQDFDSLRALLDVDIETLYEGMNKAERRRFWRGIVSEITWGEDKSIHIRY